MAYNINHHLDYSVWANETLVAKLKTLGDSILDKEVKSSFPSIAKTIMHIWDAQIVWLKRFQGTSLSAWPSNDFKGTTTETLDGLIQSSRDIQEFVASRGDAFVNGKLKYKNLKGDEFEDPADYLLHHIVNHGTYHRGQITTMLRELGVTDPPGTDIIVYWRSLKK
jgi:uncharacterized damage-inducible protein DinB